MSRASVYAHTTAEKVHSLGLEDVARIKREMEDIKEKVGSPKEEDLKTFMEKIKADPRFYYATGTFSSFCSPSSPPLPSHQLKLRPCRLYLPRRGNRAGVQEDAEGSGSQAAPIFRHSAQGRV